MTELVVAFLKLRIWDPNWDTLYSIEHALVDATLEVILERVGAGAEGSNPEFTLDPRSQATNGIVQSTVGVEVWFNMPSGLRDEVIAVCVAICRQRPLADQRR